MAEEEIETPYELPSDPGIKVYQNAQKQIVVCQESMIGDDDSFIYFSVDRADTLISFIRAVKEQILTERADEAAAGHDKRNEAGFVPRLEP